MPARAYVDLAIAAIPEPGGTTQRFDIVLPPLMLESTRAECLFAAVTNHLPLPLAAFRDMCRRFVLVLNTDSGTSCVNLGNHLQSLFIIPLSDKASRSNCSTSIPS